LIDDVAKSLDPSAPIEARGATLMFLPAYSPDLNPIEKAFAKLKQLIRSATQLPSAVPYQVQVRQLATQKFRDFVVQACARRCLARHSQSDTRQPQLGACRFTMFAGSSRPRHAGEGSGHSMAKDSLVAPAHSPLLTECPNFI
jgi:DDE superfamily endonuclease